MRSKRTLFVALAAVAVAGAMALPASVAGASSPSKLWVNGSAVPVGGTGTSCAAPGYTSIQAAINNAGNFGATINVCTGTYVEQLTIVHSVKLVRTGGPVTVQLPAAPVSNGTTCDNALADVNNVGQPGEDAVSICGAGAVSITGITVSAFFPAGDCYDSLYGVLVGNGTTLTAKGLTVNGAGVPIGDGAVGCQGGVAIQIGSARGSGQVGHATLTNTVVTGYQKAGIVASGAGTTMSVKTATVTGRGPVNTAENGIEVAFGALGTINGASVSNNVCSNVNCGPDSMVDYQASGVMFYGAAPGSGIKRSALTNNDMGIYYGSSAASEPVTPEVTIAHNTITSSVDEGIYLDQGRASLSHDVINGTGPVGIQIGQYNGQTYAPASSASHESISGQGIGVQVYSDNAVSGDLAGNFSISHSKFLHTNTTALTNNSANFTTSGTGNS